MWYDVFILYFWFSSLFVRSFRTWCSTHSEGLVNIIRYHCRNFDWIYAYASEFCFRIRWTIDKNVLHAFILVVLSKLYWLLMPFTLLKCQSLNYIYNVPWRSLSPWKRLIEAFYCVVKTRNIQWRRKEEILWALAPLWFIVEDVSLR